MMVASAAVWFAAPLAMREAQAQANSVNGMAKPAAAVSDQEILRRRGITLEQIQGLRERFGLSIREISRLPESTVQIMLWQLRHPNVDLHAAAIQFRLLKLRDEHRQIPTNAWLKAAQQREQVISGSRPGAINNRFPAVQKPGGSGPLITRNVAGIQSSGWTWLGPGNIGGRVRAILVHPTTNSIMWAGGVDGGVWKTTNSGASWFPLE